METENTKKLGITGKTKFYLFILLVGVAMTAWSVFYKDRSGGNIAGEEENKNGAEMLNENENTGMAMPDYLEGRLEKSDNQIRGNLMLNSSIGQIYIKTERDFNNLVGSDVLLFIKGTLDNFELLNIEKRIERDGYIQPQ